MADQLKEVFDVKAKLVSSKGGCFEVMVDGELVFSKLKQDRFPEKDEVVGLMKKN